MTESKTSTDIFEEAGIDTAKEQPSWPDMLSLLGHMQTKLKKIGFRISGTHYTDLTTAEKQIFLLLKEWEILKLDEDNNVVDA